MRLPKATLRKNGYKMMTVKIPFHISGSDIINGIADHVISTTNSLETLTRAEAYKATVNLLYSKGVDWFPEGSDYDDMKEEIELKAQELFPELFKKQ